MDSEYDRKFEEMKEYIPFLEGMIEKLEESNTGSNPRQAQLNKIRSLRDLLLDKKKRMKMENLLKCEQVLINLYAKVNERNAFPGPKIGYLSKKENSDLNKVRSKLKSVVSKLQSEPAETLPEIARASETEEICVPGSKEPALFQRRPNMPSTPSLGSPSRNKEIPIAKKPYTRVLRSPESNSSEHYWPQNTSSVQPLFSRRSPKKSPRKRSPSYHRKERKKALKLKSKYNQPKDLNITLNVPEDSLKSLNTKDILSRIINCSDNDVDIATLRELRTQILGELKDTGTNDDISDIILKSYKNKKNKELKDKTKLETITKNSEVEEGELSDSESEAIESIYGSLVVLDKSKPVAQGSKSLDKDKPRKIQICLVINSDKTKPSIQQEKDKDPCVDTSDFETFDMHKDQKSNEVVILDKPSFTSEPSHDDKDNVSDGKLACDLISDKENTDGLKLQIETENPEKVSIRKEENNEVNIISPKIEENKNSCENESAKNLTVDKPTFYKTLVELGQEEIEDDKDSKEYQKLDESSSKDAIPLLLEPTEPVSEPSNEVSEIDILQALKEEILSETTNVLNTDTIASASSTPLLHQPKITKVANAKEIGPKKRISIESYKAKAPVTKPTKEIKNTVKDDILRKQSLKLTEKECERFNFLSKLTLTESSDDEDKSSLCLDDIYTDFAPKSPDHEDFAPKSPDHEDFADTGLKPPVIIPSDPVQATVVGSEADVDMRKLLPNVTAYDPSTINLQSPLSVEPSKAFNTEKEMSKSDERVASPLVDPRVKRDSTSASNPNTHNSQSVHVENIQSPSSNFLTSTSVMLNVNEGQTALNVNSNTNRNSMATPSLMSLNITPNVNMSSHIPPLLPNLTPNRTPNAAPNMTPTVTPNIPPLMTPSRTPHVASMTPSRAPIMANMTPNMTPSRHAYDNEDYSSRKHVYAPMFYVSESRESMDNSRENQQTQWDAPDTRSPFWEDRNSRNSSLKRDTDYRETRKDIDYRDQNVYSMQRDVDYRRSHSVQRDIDYRDIRKNSIHNKHSFERDSDRTQCPPTPSHSFGRRECPPTPTPSFGRIDRPMTPIHPFGRSDCPLTPSHPFGRNDSLLPTPNFGRSEYNQHASRSQDPRLNRISDYDSYQYGDDDRERAYFYERQFNSGQYHSDTHLFRKYNRERSIGRNERNISDYREQVPRREASLSRSFNREERDYGRSFNRENESDRYLRNHSKRGRGYDCRNHNDSTNYDEGQRRGRERSIGRTQERVSNLMKEVKPSKLEKENMLRVNSHGGPSFTIDTSVNSSFQEMNTRAKSNFNFDARRQRASSVGRTLLPKSKTSTHETKYKFHDTENKIRNANNFRRACSVGRDFDSNKKLNFKDTKADLRSFKFKSDFRFAKDSTKHEVSRVSAEIPKNDNSRSRQIAPEIHDKSNSKYSPRKNNRDPRMRRDNSRDSKDRCSSLDSKGYGIVYSNDNISKGTILGSGYGVKNYKIPKIKRPQEFIEIRKDDDDDKNVSCSKNEFLDSEENEKHIKSQAEIKEQKFENSSDGKNITASRNVKSKDIQNQNNNVQEKIINDNCKQQEAKEEFDETETNVNETSCSKKKMTVNRKQKNAQIIKINDVKELLNNDNTKKQDESEMNIVNTSSDSMDNIERRVTRSTRKNMPDESISLELTPIKRKRTLKKPILKSDSDSDDNDKPNREDADKISQASNKQISSVVDTRKVLDTHIATVDIKTSEMSTVCEITKEKAEVNNLSEIINSEKQESDSTNKEESVLEKNKVDLKDKQIEDDLDCFSLSDLEIFPDNITSDTDVKNINALIADLDHDLDSSKNTDASSRFTNEINLETMLENITSPGKSDKKETEHISSHEQDLIQTDISYKEIEIGHNNVAKSIVEPADIKGDSCNSEKYDKWQKSEINNKVESDSAVILTPNKINFQDSETGPDFFEKECEISNSQFCVPLVEINKVNVEDTCSNDAIVSTSEDGKNFKPETAVKKHPDNETANSPSTPDSTINSNVEDLEPKDDLPFTHESGCEMNSDITSTHVTDAPIKDSLEVISSDVEKSKKVNKLLSILKDKTIWKEVLSQLDNQSSEENKKIKNKIEKISEIISDDESTLENNLVVKPNDLKSNDQNIDDHSNKNITGAQEELNKVDFDAKIQDLQENKDCSNKNISEVPYDLNKVDVDSKIQDTQKNKEVENSCETLSAQKEENKDTEKSCSVENNRSDKNVSEVQKELDKVDFDSKIQDIQNNKEMKSSFGTLYAQNEEKKGTEKSCLVENTSATSEAISDSNIIQNTSEGSVSAINKVISNNCKIIDLDNKEKIPSDSNNSSLLEENITQKDMKEIDETKINELANCDDVDRNLQNEKLENEKPTITKKKRRRGKKRIKKRKPKPTEEKRVTRSDTISLQPMALLDKPVTKKPSRELQKLQEDIREMFIKEDILSTTGIRMCRIAKLVDEKKSTEDVLPNENTEPLIVLEKCSDFNASEKLPDLEKIRKKKITKTKNKDLVASNLHNEALNTNSPKTGTALVVDYKCKAKEKKHSSSDPYNFETDSVSELNNASDKNDSSSESESDSVDSTKSSTESAEITEMKKKVKRRRGRLWQSGVIKPKNKKKKLDQKPVPTTTETISTDDIPESETRKVPDFTCFTDKTYCFRKHVLTYNCRICLYSGTDIVHHYKKEHPHTEVPLSRLSSAVAKEAIKESEDINFQGISKISSKKYVCRFCSKEFSRKKRLLEAFFWHIVSMHTGEYKQTCPKCVDTQICPLDIDIPPPPKDANGQLLGYICEKCNYTQISLENLKTHVIVWHNDEQTAVYAINLASLSKSAINNLLNRSEGVESEKPRLLRSSRSNQSMAEVSDDESDSTDESSKPLKKKPGRKINEPVVEMMNKPSHIQSKITFESDITDEISNYDTSEATVKIESDTNDIQDSQFDESHSETEKQTDELENIETEKHNEKTVSQDIFDYSHFKVKITGSGSKEYVCCINGNDNHYKTSLLISMKKHVQLKHSEKWDGYCCLCKAIVTPQGEHKFKDCLQHFLDKHMDNFPILEEIPVTQEEIPENDEPVPGDEVLEAVTTNKPKINVRPLSELISEPREPQQKEGEGPALAVIESVMSLGRVEQPRPSPSYPTPVTAIVETLKQYKYEEFQADIMSRKHLVVLEAMMSPTKLVQVFKCAGRFCSFTTDSAEDALLHASTHMKVGGIDSLNCVYCDYDSSGNAIDLITHVFKHHGCCPYVCGMCFYRAAASQLVYAHIKRVHDKATDVNVLKTTFQTPPLQEDSILTREAAVAYYLCCDQNPTDGQCKYRTYTSGKFCDHLQARHPASTEFLCFICSTSAPTPVDLVSHLKIHGLKLYQCPWCVFGAEDEMELLEHASARHPTRPPKAYLRIITNKEGTTELRVLPLAHLNKYIVPAVEIGPNTQKDFPVREAERSIELEKLIGQMIQSVAMSTETSVSERESTIQLEESPQPDVSLIENMNVLQNTETLLPRVTTPVLPESRLTTIDQPEQSTPILKSETPQIAPEKIPQLEPEIVCLDSDDETPPSVAASLPDVPPTQTSPLPTPVENEMKKVDLTQLFVCAKCNMIIKCASGFVKHINACFSKTANLIPCAHCPTQLPRKSVVTHYNSHCDKTKQTPRYYCYKCSVGFNNISTAKVHQESKHRMATSSTSLPAYIKEVAPGPKSKRKRSIQKDKAAEPPAKVTRFGPQDIDKLPINPILDDFVVCSLCGFNTKVRLNMVRHLQLHAQQQPVPQTAPVNPVPHLETNEMHFDKMLNLASSSIGPRLADKTSKTDANAPAAPTVAPDTISRYPKFVSDKQRLTCGAKGCSYISVDETMMKCHWETLHSGTNDFHCVHCPPYQQIDKSNPVTAMRIITHLKMHDEKLYACSLCSYYHHRRQILERHLANVHKGGQVLVVREGKGGDTNAPTAANASLLKTSAPTMDLKPWQCGLCQLKSLLRQDVVDHCAKAHNSKMQYKCAYCAFRTSNPENIIKHQAKSHVGKPEEIFYFYYREGSVPDEPDGTTRWQKQSKNALPSEPKVKSEDPSEIPPPSAPKSHSLLRKLATAVDLNLVKKEVDPAQETIEDLCKEFGAFCEPNGLKYKCSLCSHVMEDSLEAMQSHLYEELKYRKWGCSICSYKAFHKEGLSEHMQTEHRQNRDPIALPVDSRVETWVAKLLEHQTTLIDKYKENLAKQKAEILRTNPGPSTSKPQHEQVKESSNTVGATNKPDDAELEKIFGHFGASSNLSFCCPKCSSSFKEEDLMHTHLESELNKIRWFCSNCATKFQTYHEAQFHSRSVHSGQGARPVEATRDPTVRAAWIDAVIRTQKQSMDIVPVQTNTEKTFNQIEDLSDPAENSLLVVRYEKTIPTPEEEMARRTPASTVDSDDEKLVIDEPLESRKSKCVQKCPYCTYATGYEKMMRDHLLRHYGLKQFNCPYCDLNGTRRTIEKHQKLYHSTRPLNLVPATIPSESPREYNKKFSNPSNDATPVKVVCLVCRNVFTEADALNHIHDKILTTFGKKGEVVVQCCMCSTLHKDDNAYLRHHKSIHPELGINYVYTKLNTVFAESKEMLYACESCPQKFSQLKDMKAHADANHQSELKYKLVPKHPIINLDDYEEGQDSSKRKSDDDSILPPCKRTARKSTTKLPHTRIARKSTTKLPFNVRCETEEFSYYGAKPSTEGLDRVVTMMPFCNKLVAFTYSSLKDMINIDPAVVVDKINNPL
ncbi:uncharacterized protein LOC123871270 isoform X2 [Maniola jurtina]|uniref:uncharacterized protein LOC123871270 isoform X2 n=1 Tax=Maniola jurtina TaxID=191418 RepID=UPI001E68D222|nr:uncharacterized protein LOC123871270 isoform X2 [Maniola jurtina]